MVTLLISLCEVVLAGSYFTRKPFVLVPTFFLIEKTSNFGKDFKFVDGTFGLVLDLVLHISRPLVPGYLEKSLKNQFLPHSELKSYQIDSIKSSSSRFFQQHQRHIPIPPKFSAMI
jgi:hypothetical protein